MKKQKRDFPKSKFNIGQTVKRPGSKNEMSIIVGVVWMPRIEIYEYKLLCLDGQVMEFTEKNLEDVNQT